MFPSGSFGWTPTWTELRVQTWTGNCVRSLSAPCPTRSPSHRYPLPLLTLSFQLMGWPFLLAASSTHLLSFTHQFTVWLSLVVSPSSNSCWTHSTYPFLLLPFHSDPHFSSSSLPSLSSSHSPSPCLCFPLFSLLLPRFPSWSRCPPL